MAQGAKLLLRLALCKGCGVKINLDKTNDEYYCPDCKAAKKK